ncbi:MAG: trypsin-like serine peptidase [Flammeovirgaceae bacterium]
MKAHWINQGMSAKRFEWLAQDDQDGTFEALLAEPNFMYIWWLQKAVAVANRVARVKFPNGSATGFLVGKDLFMTNHHVFETAEDAKRAVLQFNYRILPNGERDEVDAWECDTSFFHANEELDYAIVKVKPKQNKLAGEKFGHFDLNELGWVKVGARVNIIQHPRGRFQEIAFRDNQVKAMSNHYVQYLTDTQKGSSGSPVFDDWFRLVAIHSQAVRDPRNPNKYYRNQGFLMEEIVKDLQPKLESYQIS